MKKLIKKKLLTNILSIFASTESLATGATLIRFSNVRMLVLREFSGANSTLTIPEADRPSENAISPVWRTDANYRSTAVAYMTVNAGNGYVQRYYGGTYNAAASGVSSINATDKVSGVTVWTIGGGYYVSSIMSTVSRLVRRWEHEHSERKDNSHEGFAELGRANKNCAVWMGRNEHLRCRRENTKWSKSVERKRGDSTGRLHVQSVDCSQLSKLGRNTVSIGTVIRDNGCMDRNGKIVNNFRNLDLSLRTLCEERHCLAISERGWSCA